MDPDQVYGQQWDEPAPPVENSSPWPQRRLGGGAFFRPQGEWEGGGVMATEEAPMPVRDLSAQEHRGRQLDELQGRLGQFVQEGRMRPEHARQVMAAHEADTSPYAAPAQPGLGIDVGGLTPAQAMQRVQAQPTAAAATQQQASPQEQELVAAQRNLQNARLGPADRVKMQGLANQLRQIQQQAQAGEIFPVDAHNMWQQVYPELRAMQAREAQVPLLEARVAAIQMQHQNAVASAVNHQQRAFAAANAQSEVMHATLADGRQVSFLLDMRNRPHLLHDEPMQGIPQGYRNPAELQQTIRRAQVQDWNRNVAGVPHGDRNWDAHARSIAAEHTGLYRMHHTQAQQQIREQRLAERQSGAETPQHQEQRYQTAYQHEAAAVDKEIADYVKPASANAPAHEPRPWMRGPNTGVANPHARREGEIQRRLAERGIQRPSPPTQPAGNQQQAFESLLPILLRR